MSNDSVPSINSLRIALLIAAGWASAAGVASGQAIGVPVAAAVISAAAMIVPQQAYAQIRSFPEKTKVGMLQMGNFPEALLDGERIRFAPGVRILNEANLSVVPMSIQAPTRIRYRLDAMNQVDMAWILSEAEALEAARKRQ